MNVIHAIGLFNFKHWYLSVSLAEVYLNISDYLMFILIHLGKKLSAFEGLIPSNQNENTYGKPTLRLVPPVFLMVVVVVTTGVGGVFLFISYIHNFLEIEKSCIECLWSDPMNVKAKFLYSCWSLRKNFF